MVFSSRRVWRSSSPSQFRSSISSFWSLLLVKDVIFYPTKAFLKSILDRSPWPKFALLNQDRPSRPSKRKEWWLRTCSHTVSKPHAHVCFVPVGCQKLSPPCSISVYRQGG